MRPRHHVDDRPEDGGLHSQSLFRRIDQMTGVHAFSRHHGAVVCARKDEQGGNYSRSRCSTRRCELLATIRRPVGSAAFSRRNASRATSRLSYQASRPPMPYHDRGLRNDNLWRSLRRQPGCSRSSTIPVQNQCGSGQAPRGTLDHIHARCRRSPRRSGTMNLPFVGRPQGFAEQHPIATA